MTEKKSLRATNILNSSFDERTAANELTDGVALTSIAHPAGPDAPPHYLWPRSLETVEIDVPERNYDYTINYDPLPIACDLGVLSLEAAVAQLNPQVSCDLWVSKYAYEANIGQMLLRDFRADYIVNRVRCERALKPREWFVECGDGRMVGSCPP